MAGFFHPGSALRGPLLVSLLAAALSAPGRATAQGLGMAPDAGCVARNGTYVCNWSTLKLALERAHNVSLETSPMDRPTAHQLDALLTELGKTRVSPGQAADLTFLLIPVEPTGLNIGPGDHDLATLRIYAPTPASNRGTLLWAETYRGQGDRPWHAQVHALIAQFQERLPKAQP